MWYILPLLDRLGVSSTSKYFSIKSTEEARAFLEHPVLGLDVQLPLRAVQERGNRHNIARVFDCFPISHSLKCLDSQGGALDGSATYHQ